MVAPLIAAAGVSALGSVIGGVTGGKGAKAAAKTAQQTAQKQIAAAQQNQQYLTGLSQPTLDRGNQAGALTANFLGMNGGTAAADALSTYRGSTGYQDLLNEGLGAVNANAYARGMGDSGATLKALQTRGMSLADRSSGDWLSRLGGLQQLGQQAVGNIAGVAMNTTNNIAGYNQNASDAQGNSALIQSANWQKALQGVFNAGSYAMGSSFGGGQQGQNNYGVKPMYPYGGGIY